MVAKPLCPLYKNIIKPLDRARYPELRSLVFLLSMTCHAQKISMSDLVGKTWVADSGYDGCGNIDWNIVFSAKSSEHKFVGKSDNKVSVFTYNTYLCSYSPEKYEASLLGNTNGKYIVFERKYTYKGKEYEDFFCGEILSLESNRLTIRMKHSTILYIAK